MLKTTVAVALAALALPALTLPVQAGEVRTATPIEAKSLATDDLQMVAYFVPGADNRYDVTATWLQAGDAEAGQQAGEIRDRHRAGRDPPGDEIEQQRHGERHGEPPQRRPSAGFDRGPCRQRAQDRQHRGDRGQHQRG